ncbi:AAA family ATPase [Cohnella faecalis]|nr:AAA family ATPase [Cohnella faecalis]
MAVNVVIAIGNRDYAAKLSRYLREAEPEWETAAVTQQAALRRELASFGQVDLLAASPEFLADAGESKGSAAIRSRVALVEYQGQGGGARELSLYQPFPQLAAAIRSILLDNEIGCNREARAGTLTLGVFSASGGVGKSTIALNVVRQAAERGWRTFYLNMETLDPSGTLFGAGEPDRLSRLLYAMQAYPERFGEELGRAIKHQPTLRADYIDAPDHPGERMAMTSEQLEKLIQGIRDIGRYDIVVVDSDSGATDKHKRLQNCCDRVLWVVTDEWTSMVKAEQLHRYWQGEASGTPIGITYVLNKKIGELMNGWKLPGRGPDAVLPYIPQWKAIDQPGKWFLSPAFSGALEAVLDRLGLTEGGPPGASGRSREKEGSHSHGSHGSGGVVRGIG